MAHNAFSTNKSMPSKFNLFNYKTIWLCLKIQLRTLLRNGFIFSKSGSRRSSLASLQSTSSSVRSYSMKRFEKEREQKEKRQQMQMRLAQLHANMTGDNGKAAPTPSPRTPNSTDGLLPAVTEGREVLLTL